MKYHYKRLKDQGLEVPHILALTASIVTSKVKDVYKFLEMKEELEERLDSKTITTHDLADLLKGVQISNIIFL